MDTKEKQGIHIIHCRNNDAYYVGKSKKLFSRLRSYFHKPEREDHEIPLLQRDWILHGKTAFSFHFWPLDTKNLHKWEAHLIIVYNALEHKGGYNKMTGNSQWGLSARIRDTEAKLRRAGKFCYLNTTWLDERLNSVYIKTFHQDNEPIHLIDRFDMMLQAFIDNQHVKDAQRNLLCREFKVWHPH